MRVSIHIPKTAGQSWEAQLGASFGPRLLLDKEFEDKVNSIESYREIFEKNTPRAEMRDREQRAKLLEQRETLMRDYDAIHGHFVADKYVGVFPATDFVATFRDPYQQMVSAYYFMKRKEKESFEKFNPTLPQFIAAFSNMQSPFLGSVTLGDLAMVGLTEQYERSVALFEAIFGKKISQDMRRVNTNPDRQGATYEIDAEVKAAVDHHCAADIELYRRAQERFQKLASRYGV